MGAYGQMMNFFFWNDQVTFGLGQHSHTPTAPKYRLEGITVPALHTFFDAYIAGTLPRYYQSMSPRASPVSYNSIRELTSWDFVGTVEDPDAAVLVQFVSQN